MTEHGFRDGWPAIQLQVLGADILVLITPSSLGERASAAAPGDRAALQLLGRTQRRRPMRLLRPRRRLPDHRQRGQHRTRRDGNPLRAPTPRPRCSTPSRRRLDRRGRPWHVLRRRTRRRHPRPIRQRLHPEDTTFMTWTCSTSPAPSAAPAVSRPTATSGSARHPVAPSAVTTGLTVARSQPGQGIRDTAVPVGAWEGAQSGT